MSEYCIICFSEDSGESNKLINLPCSCQEKKVLDKVHHNCLKEWFDSGNSEKNCPLCRNLFTEDVLSIFEYNYHVKNLICTDPKTFLLNPLKDEYGIIKCSVLYENEHLNLYIGNRKYLSIRYKKYINFPLTVFLHFVEDSGTTVVRKIKSQNILGNSWKVYNVLDNSQKDLEVLYDKNRFANKPRKFKIIKNNVEYDCVDPQFSEKYNGYCLDFFGRVTTASTKNCIVSKIPNDNSYKNILMLFGKLEDFRYNLDVQSPLSIADAFSIAIIGFIRKISVL